MANYVIEARSFSIALLWCHNFWVLKNAVHGTAIAELHGLAYDPVRQMTLPIGTSKAHRLRVFVYPHALVYAARFGSPIHSTRMLHNSSTKLVYDGADALSRWETA